MGWVCQISKVFLQNIVWGCKHQVNAKLIQIQQLFYQISMHLHYACGVVCYMYTRSSTLRCILYVRFSEIPGCIIYLYIRTSFDRDEQLLTAASRPVFSGTINRGDQAVVHPHVYNLLARAKQSSAFVIGTKVRLSTQ